jgi:hypothetical protein
LVNREWLSFEDAGIERLVRLQCFKSREEYLCGVRLIINIDKKGFLPLRASPAARVTLVVVLPDPPFCVAMERIIDEVNLFDPPVA